MPKALVHVSPEIWQWVLSAVNVDGDDKDKLEEWASGRKLPTLTQLEKFGRKTHIPVGYFFLNNPPVEECRLTEFRTACSVPLKRLSRELYETANKMEDIQDWTREYLVDNGMGKNRFAGSIDPNMPGLVAAEKVRGYLRLDVKWFGKSKSANDSFKLLREAASDAGILVMKNGVVGNNTSRKLDVNEFRAFALIDDYAPLIFVNSADTAEGKVFSLIHELVHVGVGTNSLYNPSETGHTASNPLEKFCNGVTAEILMPIEIFKEKWNENSEDADARIASVSGYFKCGRLAIARRALDSGFLTNEKYAQAAGKAKTATSRRSSGGGNYYGNKASNLDPRFLLALYSSVREGKTLYTDAFQLTDTNIATFKGLLEHVSGERK